MSIYLCSDLHGQYDLYMKMLDDIRFSQDDHLYILGDIIDRGPKSIEILRDVMKRDNVTCLIGNHEMMMLDHLNRNRERGSYWTMSANGGTVTKRGFNKLPDQEKTCIIDYLNNLYLQIEMEMNGKKFLLSHSSFLVDLGTVRWRDLDEKIVFNTVWNSPWRFYEHVPLQKYREDGRFHVIGHVPTVYIDDRDWPEGRMPAMPSAYVDHANCVVNIDLGCARMARLSRNTGLALCCMNLDSFASGNEEQAFQYYR